MAAEGITFNSGGAGHRGLMRRFLLVAAILFASCTSPAITSQPQSTSAKIQYIDKSKFEKLYRSAKATEAAATIGVNYQKFGELIQGFATELSIAGDFASTADEKRLLEMFSGIMESYRDSLAVWKAKIDFSGKDLPFSGAIPSVELSQLAKKHGLPEIAWPESPRLKLIPEGVIQYLWTEASDRLSAASAIYAGKPRPTPEGSDRSILKTVIYSSLMAQVQESEGRVAQRKKNATVEAELEKARRQRHIEAIAREATELDPEQIVFCDIGGPYYHFDASCRTWKSNALSVSRAHLWRMPLREARTKLARCPDCESPLYVDPNATVYYFPKDPYYHREDCKDLPEIGRLAVALSWAATKLKPCPICRPPIIGK
jgi:hypothetical protein